MANVDRPHGFNIWGKLKGANMYAVPTAPTINIPVGDLVLSDNSAVDTAKLGRLISVKDDAVFQATTGDANPVIGAVLACFDSNLDPCLYIAAGAVGDGTTAGYVLVADDPDQEFEAQEDGDTAAIAAADMGLNFEVVSATLSAPNTSTGISTQEIDSDSHNVTATIPVKVLRMAYPNQDAVGSAGCRYICKINPDCHLKAAGTAI